MSLHRSLACGFDTTLINSPSTPETDLIKWESVAKHILRGYDNHDIQLLCGFFPFEDTDILYSLLRNRWVPFLNAFVIYIEGETYSRKFVDALSVDQKIQYIFKSLEIPFSSPESRWEWSWTSHEALNEIASIIAFNIDKDSCSQFAKIPFKDLVKQALDDDVKSLLKFIAQHVRLSIQISRYLREYSHVRSKYIQVEKVSRLLQYIYTNVTCWMWWQKLKTQSSFAHRALSYALQPGLSTSFFEFYKILDFLIKPVQKLFKKRNIREALRLLNILAMRHQHAYQRSGRSIGGRIFKRTRSFSTLSPVWVSSNWSICSTTTITSSFFSSPRTIPWRMIIPYNFCTDDETICAKGSKSASLLMKT